MAYKELVKDISSVREYLRDFLIFGFRTRKDFSGKSARTYDDERRRIEGWLGGALSYEYRTGGKAVFLSLDAASLPTNPLFRAFEAKSFTDNDITLHFFLLTLLADGRARHAEEIQAGLNDAHGRYFETSTLRRKLAEYEALGLLAVTKRGTKKCYTLAPLTASALLGPLSHAAALLQFARGAMPLSVVGHFLSDGLPDASVRMKHSYLSAVLEEEVLLALLSAIREKRAVLLTKQKDETVSVLPLRILWSTQTGRHYLLARTLTRRRLSVFRLDAVRSAAPLKEPLETEAGDHRLPAKLLRPLWGTSTAQRRPEVLTMTVTIDENEEFFIVQRLRRESRGGHVEQLYSGLWRFTRKVADAGEMQNWIKTFTGRIASLESTSGRTEERFADDIRRMSEMYGISTERK